jgi:hypothetical protein
VYCNASECGGTARDWSLGAIETAGGSQGNLRIGLAGGNDLVVTTGGNLEAGGDITVNGNDVRGGAGNLVLTGGTGSYVEVKSLSATYGLIVREYNSSDFGNIEVTANGLDFAYGSSGADFRIDTNGNAIVTSTTAGEGLIANDAFVGTWSNGTDYVAFGSKTRMDGFYGNYALLQQTSTGATFLNSATATTLYFRQGNTTRAYIDAGGDFNISNSLLVNTVRSTASASYYYSPGTTSSLYFGSGDDHLELQADLNIVYYRNGAAWWVATNNVSDVTLKKNVAEITNPLQKLAQIRGVTFNWIDASTYGSQQEVGVIAQEVEAVLPQVVGTNAQTGKKYVDYAKLTALLIQGVNEQQDEITTLQNQLANQTFVGLNQVSAASITSTDLTVTGTATIGDLNVTGIATVAELIVTGDTNVQDLYVNGKIVSQGSLPTVLELAAAGVNGPLPSDPQVLGAVTGNDIAGTASITTGVNATSGKLIKVIFDQPYSQAPIVTLTPLGKEGAELDYYVDTVTTTSFTIATVNAPQDDTEYVFQYQIIQ